MTSSDLLDGLVRLAIDAGRVVARIYASDFAVAAKADASPVTKADVEAEAVILAGLARLAPDVPTVSEEAQSAGAEARFAKRFFLVDPLDGTREFVSRNGEFTVNVALVEDGAPVLGVVLAPALGRMWFGGRGLGAHTADLAGSGEPRPIAVRAVPASGPVAVVSRSHLDRDTAAWMTQIGTVATKSIGSSLKLCLVAEGEADVYPRFGRTMLWDIAAGDAVLRAAGGLVTDLGGHPLVYGPGKNARDPLANPPFVAWGDAYLRARCGL